MLYWWRKPEYLKMITDLLQALSITELYQVYHTCFIFVLDIDPYFLQSKLYKILFLIHFYFFKTQTKLKFVNEIYFNFIIMGFF
jgi:hypothetical protein